MSIKKFLCALLVVMIFAAGSFAASSKSQEVKLGVITYLGTTEEDFQKGIDELRKLLRVRPALPMISRQNYERKFSRLSKKIA